MIRVLKRDGVRILSSTEELDEEFQAALDTHRELLAFEFEHQAMLDAAYPRIFRVNRILWHLYRRKNWAEKGRGWKPGLREGLRKKMEELQTQLKKERNADPKWKELLAWPRDPTGAVDRNGKPQTRRAAYHAELRARRKVSADTFDERRDAVDFALKTVLKKRKAGKAAGLHKPRWSDGGSLTARIRSPGKLSSAIRIVSQSPCWWTVRMRIGKKSVAQFSAKLGSCKPLPDDAQLVRAQLTRTRDGERWRYSVALTFRGSFESPEASGYVVGIDTGHRVRGNELRACYWYGEDGEHGELLLPSEIQYHSDRARRIGAEIDSKYNRLPEEQFTDKKLRNRHAYRRKLMSMPREERTQAELDWLSWEMTQMRKIQYSKKRMQNLRDECYRKFACFLKKRYSLMAIDTAEESIRQLDTNKVIKRNRDMSAPYRLRQILANKLMDLKVEIKNSTRECTQCGHIREGGAVLMLECKACGFREDQDLSAAKTLCRRGVLAKDSAAA